MSVDPIAIQYPLALPLSLFVSAPLDSLGATVGHQTTMKLTLPRARVRIALRGWRWSKYADAKQQQ